MNTRNFKEFADLYGKGFRPYKGEVVSAVYEKLDCPHPEKAYWICRWPLLYCFGCKRRCTPSPKGFQIMLPDEEVKQHDKFNISPSKMLASKNLLRADEAAYCLNVSPSQVYRLAAEGKLIRHLDLPFRVTSDSVINELKRIDL
tara:strand:+ start:90 stop:521 length:432 start_codon:yes stop_codon:yes gene_type:complete